MQPDDRQDSASQPRDDAADRVAPLPFRPVGAGFAGWPMPASVPSGVRLELSRARLLDGAEARFADWMAMLHDRYDECLATLPGEQMAVEATFLNQEPDGSWWMYHLQIVGADSPGLDVANDVDRAHDQFARTTKLPGWEELRPELFLAPPAVRAAIVEAAGAPTEEQSVARYHGESHRAASTVAGPASDERPRGARRATRVLVVHHSQTLLFRDTDPGVPGSSWWTTPGGGLDEGESWVDAGVREVFEETGLKIEAADLRGPVAHRVVTHGYSDRVTTQEEMFFRLELTDTQFADGISTAGHTASERQRIVEHSWISRERLAGLTVWPAQLGELLTADPDAGVRDLGHVEESTVPVGTPRAPEVSSS